MTSRRIFPYNGSTCSDPSDCLLGHVHSLNARCFTAPMSFMYNDKQSGFLHALCTHVQCNSVTSAYSVKVAGAAGYTACPPGAELQLALLSSNFSSGTLVCQSYDAVCTGHVDAQLYEGGYMNGSMTISGTPAPTSHPATPTSTIPVPPTTTTTTTPPTTSLPSTITTTTTTATVVPFLHWKLHAMLPHQPVHLYPMFPRHEGGVGRLMHAHQLVLRVGMRAVATSTTAHAAVRACVGMCSTPPTTVCGNCHLRVLSRQLGCRCQGCRCWSS